MFKKLFKNCCKPLVSLDLFKNESENEWEMVWGIKSGEDLNGETEATLYTMNDFDICYNKKTNKYIMSVETIYEFEGGIEAQKKYLLYILSSLTEWMQQKNYILNFPITMEKVFVMDRKPFFEFDTIEELYAYFKLLVNGFCSQEVQKNDSTFCK